METRVLYIVYETSKVFKRKGFKYEPLMSDYDPYSTRHGIFKDLEQAKEELSKHSGMIYFQPDGSIMVVECFINEEIGYFDEYGDYEFVDNIGVDYVARVENFIAEEDEENADVEKANRILKDHGFEIITEKL